MDKDKNIQQEDLNEKQPATSKPHSSAFNEQSTKDQKSTTNAEDADLEQTRKEAATERD